MKNYFLNEVDILKNTNHQNIIKLFEIKNSHKNFYLVMEYCNGGTLQDLFDKYYDTHVKPFPENFVQHILRQVSCGLYYLHKSNIIHRDLKMENILFNFESDEDKKKLNVLKAQLKIIDFGFAKYLNDSSVASSICGSPINMDPVILKALAFKQIGQDFGYTEKADMWSLGIMVYTMLIGKPPFIASNYKDLYLQINEGNYHIPKQLKLSKQAISLINGLLQFDNKERLSIDELIYHEFLTLEEKDFEYCDLNYIDKGNRDITLNNKEDVKKIWDNYQVVNNNEVNLAKIRGNLGAKSIIDESTKQLAGDYDSNKNFQAFYIDDKNNIVFTDETTNKKNNEARLDTEPHDNNNPSNKNNLNGVYSKNNNINKIDPNPTNPELKHQLSRRNIVQDEQLAERLKKFEDQGKEIKKISDFLKEEMNKTPLSNPTTATTTTTNSNNQTYNIQTYNNQNTNNQNNNYQFSNNLTSNNQTSNNYINPLPYTNKEKEASIITTVTNEKNKIYSINNNVNNINNNFCNQFSNNQNFPIKAENDNSNTLQDMKNLNNNPSINPSNKTNLPQLTSITQNYFNNAFDLKNTNINDNLNNVPSAASFDDRYIGLSPMLRNYLMKLDEEKEKDKDKKNVGNLTNIVSSNPDYTNYTPLKQDKLYTNLTNLYSDIPESKNNLQKPAEIYTSDAYTYLYNNTANAKSNNVTSNNLYFGANPNTVTNTHSDTKPFYLGNNNLNPAYDVSSSNNISNKEQPTKTYSQKDLMFVNNNNNYLIDFNFAKDKNNNGNYVSIIDPKKIVTVTNTNTTSNNNNLEHNNTNINTANDFGPIKRDTAYEQKLNEIENSFSMTSNKFYDFNTSPTKADNNRSKISVFQDSKINVIKNNNYGINNQLTDKNPVKIEYKKESLSLMSVILFKELKNKLELSTNQFLELNEGVANSTNFSSIQHQLYNILKNMKTQMDNALNLIEKEPKF